MTESPRPGECWVHNSGRERIRLVYEPAKAQLTVVDLLTKKELFKLGTYLRTPNEFVSYAYGWVDAWTRTKPKAEPENPFVARPPYYDPGSGGGRAKFEWKIRVFGRHHYGFSNANGIEHMFTPPCISPRSLQEWVKDRYPNATEVEQWTPKVGEGE